MTRSCAPWVEAAGLACDTEGFEPLIVQRAIDVASDVCWALSGRQFGLCHLVVRPCRARFEEPQVLDQAYFSDGWNWLPLPVCTHQQGCGCTRLDAIHLPGPVRSVVSVTVDGVTLSRSKYRLVRPNVLERLDGENWPECQDLSADPGSLLVSITRGRPVPPGGVAAASELACELARHYSGRSCSLPKRVTTVTRKDVTMAMLDPMDFLTKGRTGLYSVDLFLTAVNPKGLRRRATVFAADSPRQKSRVDRSSDVDVLDFPRVIDFDGYDRPAISQGSYWPGFRVRLTDGATTDPLAQIRTGPVDQGGQLVETMRATDDGDGWWHFDMTFDQTTALPFLPLVYDIELTEEGADPLTVIRGSIRVIPEVSRA